MLRNGGTSIKGANWKVDFLPSMIGSFFRLDFLLKIIILIFKPNSHCPKLFDVFLFVYFRSLYICHINPYIYSSPYHCFCMYICVSITRAPAYLFPSFLMWFVF